MAQQLILDTLGGDLGPQAILEGATQALRDLRFPLQIIGNQDEIRPLLEKRSLRSLAKSSQVQLTHTTEIIGMEDSIRAIRSKPNASINLGCKQAAESQKSGEPSAFISTGHSGAMMASALLQMGRLHGVERPGIAVTLPSLSPHGCVVLDVGANVDCKPNHLRDFGIMGAIYAQARTRGKLHTPRVGILSNGEERTKGTDLTREAYQMLENFPGLEKICKFLGYVEGKEIFRGDVDVVITDGFVGNVVLKSLEGLGSAIVSMLKAEARSTPINTLGFLIASRALKNLKKKLDYAEYGAAPLLGVAGYAMVCHGRSNAKAIQNALLRAQEVLEMRFVERLETALTEPKLKSTS